MYVWYRVIFLLFSWMHTTSPQRCAFKRETSFDQCGSRKAEVQRYNDRDINRHKPWIVTNDIACNNTAVCQRLFRYVLCFMRSYLNLFSFQLFGRNEPPFHKAWDHLVVEIFRDFDKSG